MPVRDAELLLSLWRAELSSRGHLEALVWLPHQSLTLQHRLYYRPVDPPLTDAEVARAIERLDPDELCAFSLLGSGNMGLALYHAARGRAAPVQVES